MAGPLDAAFTGIAQYFSPGQALGECSDEFEAMSGSCTARSVGCPSGRCIMASTVDGTDWSDCSKVSHISRF